MIKIQKNYMIYVMIFSFIFLLPLISFSQSAKDLDESEENSLFDFASENKASQDVEDNEAKQEMMENALELLEEADKLWAKGELEDTLDTLDEAYSLILDANGDAAIAQEKDDVRLLIAQRILSVYSSKRAVIKGKNSEIQLTINSDVQKEIYSFQGPERDSFIAAYQRSNMYRPEIIKEIKKAGIPEEFFWLPLVESLFKIHAYSPARALGLWQFIPSTGYKYGLSRDEWIDDRMDVQKSTKAAIAYLKDLHNMFGDWLTALAAYNCGEGRVLRVISRQHINYLDSFWDLYRQLPNETARYVPRFLATLLIVNNPQKYGFDLSHTAKPIAYGEVKVNKIMKIKDIAEKIEISEEVLNLLNPALRYKMTPDREYHLKLPEGYLEKFNVVYNDIPASEKPSLAFVQNGNDTGNHRISRHRSAYVKHRVKRGETVYSIAKKYGVSVSNIRSLNRLGSKKKLVQGRILTIPVARKSYAAEKADKNYQSEITSSGRYKVKKGDTLLRISRHFNISLSKLKDMNNLNSGEIFVGQTLIINKQKSKKSKIGKKILSSKDIDKLGKDKYIVTKNDSLHSIAKKHNTNLSKLMELNQISMNEKIVPGQILIVK